MFKIMRRALGVAAIAASVTMLSATSASAAIVYIIDFDQSVFDGGTVTEAGGEYTGTDIIFTSIYLVELDTTTNVQTKVAGVQCGPGDNINGPAPTKEDACFLNFDTATGEFVVVAEGGLYDIGACLTGPCSAFQNPGVLVAADGAVVLDGQISKFGVLLDGDQYTFSATGTDTKNASLLTFFELDSSLFRFANTEIVFGENGAVLDADLTNRALVPEPGSLALLGLGFLAAGRAVRRRRNKA